MTRRYRSCAKHGCAVIENHFAGRRRRAHTCCEHDGRAKGRRIARLRRQHAGLFQAVEERGEVVPGQRLAEKAGAAAELSAY